MQWRNNINHINPESKSGGRLHIYRNIKNTLATERYILIANSVGGRRVMAGLRMGCLPLAVVTPISHMKRGCAGYVIGEMWRTNHIFYAYALHLKI